MPVPGMRRPPSSERHGRALGISLMVLNSPHPRGYPWRFSDASSPYNPYSLYLPCFFLNRIHPFVSQAKHLGRGAKPAAVQLLKNAYRCTSPIRNSPPP